MKLDERGEVTCLGGPDSNLGSEGLRLDQGRQQSIIGDVGQQPAAVSFKSPDNNRQRLSVTPMLHRVALYTRDAARIHRHRNRWDCRDFVVQFRATVVLPLHWTRG